MSSNLHAAEDLTESTHHHHHHQITESSILYLIEETTKLSPPAADDDNRLPDPSGDVHNIFRSDFSGCFSVTRDTSDNSDALEVMRLINQQCEWLLRSGCRDDEDRTEIEPSDIAENVPVPVSTSNSRYVSAAVDDPSEVCSSSFYVVPSTDDVSDENHEDETKEPDGLADLIMSNSSENICVIIRNENSSLNPDVSRDETHMEDSVTPLDQIISPVDFTSSLIYDREPENAWITVNVYEDHQTDVNNNNLSLDKELVEDQESKFSRPVRRMKRKQSRPVRSPESHRPDVMGVTFTMRPEPDPNADDCKLVITSNCSEEIRRLRNTRIGRCKTSQRTSSSDEESDSCGSSSSKSKMCASCLTRKTPLWRDAEDGTPLCNACGIRYKKYRVRCHHCWNIPKKDAKSNSVCLKCGDVLRLNSHHKYNIL